MCVAGSSPAARAEEDGEEADEDEADQSESHVEKTDGWTTAKEEQLPATLCETQHNDNTDDCVDLRGRTLRSF